VRKADEVFEFRLARSEKAVIVAASERLGVSASELVRNAALTTADIVLDRAPPAQPVADKGAP